MFLRILTRVKNGTTYKYLKLVENVRRGGKVTQKVLLNFGNVNNWPLERLQEFIYKLNEFYNLEIVPTAQDVPDPENVFEFGPHYALHQIWQKLELSESLRHHSEHNQAEIDLVAPVKTMVFNRLIAPRSKLQVHHWAKRQAIPEVYPHRVPLQNYYRALDYLMDHKESLEKNIFWKVNDLFNIDLSLVFYDLTSSYFEGKHCEIAKHGYSRDHRPDRRQIEVALLVNRDGIPIAHEVWEGNIKDSETVADALQRLKKEFNIRRCVFVGDNGLVTPDNLELLNNYGYEYILSLKLRKDPRASAILDSLSVEDYRHFEKLKDNLLFKELSPVAAGERIVACYNPIRAESSRSKRQQRLRESRDYLEGFKLPRKRGQHRDPEKIHRQIERWLSHKGTLQFFNYHYHKEGDFEYHLQEDVLAREEKCDGLCLLLAKSSKLSAEDIATGYRTLTEVEDAFREIKSFLRIRPVYHYKEIRVRGHVFICVLAYLLEKFLERELVTHGIEFSAKAALDALTSLHVVTYEVMGHEVTKICKADKEQQCLLKALGIKEVPRIYPFPIPKIRN